MYKTFVHAPEAFTVGYKSFIQSPEAFTVGYNFVHAPEAFTVINLYYSTLLGHCSTALVTCLQNRSGFAKTMAKALVSAAARKIY